MEHGYIKSDAARWLIENWNNSNTNRVMPDNPEEDIPPAPNSESKNDSSDRTIKLSDMIFKLLEQYRSYWLKLRDEPAVSRRLGHSSISTTSRVMLMRYSRLMKLRLR